MKLRQLILPAVSLLLVLPLAGETFDSKAQNPPPITPAIDREDGGGRYVTASNIDQGAPVLAQVQIRIGKRTYGDGFLTLTNVSDKPIVGLRGAWEFIISNGGLVPRGWDFGGATDILRGGWKPGREVTLPIAAPPDFVVGEPHEIRNVAVRITGVVFKDGSHWGEEADYVDSRLEREIVELRAVAERLREACEKLPPQAIVDQLAATDMQGLGLFPSKLYQLIFEKWLLDENHALRPDALQTLNKMIAALKNPFAH